MLSSIQEHVHKKKWISPFLPLTNLALLKVSFCFFYNYFYVLEKDLPVCLIRDLQIKTLDFFSERFGQAYLAYLQWPFNVNFFFFFWQSMTSEDPFNNFLISSWVSRKYCPWWGLRKWHHMNKDHNTDQLKSYNNDVTSGAPIRCNVFF